MASFPDAYMRPLSITRILWGKPNSITGYPTKRYQWYRTVLVSVLFVRINFWISKRKAVKIKRLDTNTCLNTRICAGHFTTSYMLYMSAYASCSTHKICFINCKQFSNILSDNHTPFPKISILRHVRKVVLAICSLHPGLKETYIIMNYFSQNNYTIWCQMLHFV